MGMAQNSSSPKGLPIGYVPYELCTNHLPQIERLMFGEVPNDDVLPQDPDTYTLVAGLDKLVHTTDNGVKPSVDAIGFTAMSAVPIADTIRGLFEVLGMPTPTLFTLLCNKNTAMMWKRSPGIRTSEVDRLAKDLHGMTSATIIDQYVFMGTTLRHATSIVHDVGIPTVQTLPGRWYYNAMPARTEINLDTLTSKYSDTFKRIGRKLAAIYCQQNLEVLKQEIAVEY